MFCSNKLLLRVVKTVVYDSQGQVEQEKLADVDHGHKEPQYLPSVDLLVEDHDLTPTFKGDALKDCEHGPEDVVEIGHIIVWIDGSLTTEELRWGSLFVSTVRVITTDYVFSKLVICDFSSLKGYTSLQEHATEKVDTSNSKDKEEKDKHKDGVLQQWEGSHHRLNLNLQSLNLGYRSKWSKHSEGSKT